MDIESLNIERGKIYGLIGDNGAGKTTLFRLLTGMEFPSSGMVIHDDAMKNISALIEQPAVDEELSGYDNLKYVSILCGYKHDKEIQEKLRLVKLYEERKKKVKEYSLGMKQRLGIAMALMNEPDLLFLDEPLNGVDPKGVVEFREMIKSIHANGVTVVISSHILSELQKLATDFLFLKKGKLVKQLTRSEMESFQSEKYVINVENSEEALRIIECMGGNAEINCEGNVVVEMTDLDIREIVDALERSGVKMREFYKQKIELEEVYKDIM